MNLIQCFQRNSKWYKEAARNGTPVGILWHDTAGGNPTIKRYVQPYETDADYAEKIALLGKNPYGNDWNHINHDAGLNAWIGKLADGTVATVQAGEWDIHAWGCGGDSAGSCNGYIKTNGVTKWVSPFWVQFEICDDGYKDEAYFRAVYKEACEFTAYICKLFGIDPKGTVKFNGIEVPTILCHADSHKLKLGGNHGDVYPWFNKFGKTMEDVRNDVAALINATKQEQQEPSFRFEKLDVVRIKDGVNTYSNGVRMASFVLTAKLYVREIRKNGTVVVSTLKTGDVTGVVNPEDLVLVERAKAEETPVADAPAPETPAEEPQGEPETEPEQEAPEEPAEQPEEIPAEEPQEPEQPKQDAATSAETCTDVAGDAEPAETEQEPTEGENVSTAPEIAHNDVGEKEPADGEGETQYIETPEEAANFAVRLLNAIIAFILKVFGKR